MEGKIEKMVRMRRNILGGILLGYGILHGSFIVRKLILTQAMQRWGHREFRPHWEDLYFIKNKYIFDTVGILALCVLLAFLIRYLIYKRRLMKNPDLSSGVNDERIKQNWLKAYRLAFFVLLISQVLFQVFIQFLFSNRLHLSVYYLSHHLTFYLAIVSCISAFIFYNRGEQVG